MSCPRSPNTPATGEGGSNPDNKLFEERIIFLDLQIDESSANDVMAQLLALESADPDRDITMYINSQGGSFASTMAIYDTMQFIRPQLQTVCLGHAGGGAAVLLAAGTRGKRLAVEDSHITILRASTEGVHGQVPAPEIQAAEVSRIHRLLERMLARHTGQTEERIRTDIERHARIFTATEAKEYGIIDDVIARSGSSPLGKPDGGQPK